MIRTQKVRQLSLIVATVAMLTGCSRLATTDSRCELAARHYEVGIFGGLGAVGRLGLEPQQGGIYSVTLAVFEKLIPDAKPLIVLQGVGQCHHGLLESRFGGDAGENAQVKVLGGVIESVFAPNLIDQPFGAWQMEILQKSDQKTASLNGFWQVIAPAPST